MNYRKLVIFHTKVRYMPAYKDLEDQIIKLFNNTTSLSWNGIIYDQIKACKPSLQGGGECKTDIFVLLNSSKNSNLQENLKISVKKSNAEFYGNKLTEVAAQTLLGPNWQTILIRSINPIISRFQSQPIVYTKPKNNPTDAYFTLGWKLEITDKPRLLSTPLIISNKEIVDNVYRGTNQPVGKKNAYVFGEILIDAGIADYLYKGEITSTSQEIVNKLQDLRSYQSPQLYLAFTANNYRVNADKADGPRSLAIAIKWSHQNGKLHPTYIFDKPLTYKGETDMQPHIKSALKALNSDNFATLDISAIKP